MSGRARRGKSVRPRPSITSTREGTRSQEHASSRTHSTSQVESIPVSQSVSHEGTNEGATSKRRGRGRAKPWKGWGKEKMILGWNELCQPIGEYRQNFGTQLGYFARQGNLFPLTMSSWREADENHVETVWKNIQDNTNAPDGFKDICFKKIGASWRKFKGCIKDDYYKKFQTNEERLANVPPGVEPDQWQVLVARWGTSKSERVAAQNSKNRANLSCYHKMGKKSFAEVKEEMKAKNLKVDKLSVYRYTRKMDGGVSHNDGSAEKDEMITRMLEELSPEEREDEAIRDKIFEEVIGEDGHGRSLCMGVGIPPSSKRLKATSSSSQDKEEIAQLRKEAEERDIRDKERELRHQEEIATVRAEMNDKFIKTNEFVINMMRQAGISIPDDTPWMHEQQAS